MNEIERQRLEKLLVGLRHDAEGMELRYGRGSPQAHAVWAHLMALEEQLYPMPDYSGFQVTALTDMDVEPWVYDETEEAEGEHNRFEWDRDGYSDPDEGHHNPDDGEGWVVVEAAQPVVDEEIPF